MQLVAYGAQDIYLTGNPQITFFKVVYRRHTNFSMEAIEQSASGSSTVSLNSENEASFTISRNGDLIHKVYLTADASNHKITQGSKIIKEVEISIGGQMIDRHTQEWHDIWNELTTTSSKSNGFKAMTGDMGSGGHENVISSLKSVKFVQIPLLFWFCRNPGLALPLIALQYHEVKINFVFNNLETIGDHYNNGISDPINLQLFVDYIYLDTDERKRFAQVSHEYLIEQLQIKDTNDSIVNELNFNHPVKEIIWTSVRGNDYGSAQLKLNGHDRFSKQQEEYFQLRQPFDYHTSIPHQNVPISAAYNEMTSSFIEAYSVDEENVVAVDYIDSSNTQSIDNLSPTEFVYGTLVKPSGGGLNLYTALKATTELDLIDRTNLGEYVIDSPYRKDGGGSIIPDTGEFFVMFFRSQALVPHKFKNIFHEGETYNIFARGEKWVGGEGEGRTDIAFPNTFKVLKIKEITNSTQTPITIDGTAAAQSSPLAFSFNGTNFAVNDTLHFVVFSALFYEDVVGAYNNTSPSFIGDYTITEINEEIVDQDHHLEASTSHMTKKINVYSFALKPEEHQPSGSCNFSRIDTAQLITDNKIGLECHIYAVNYNVLRIMSGMGGLAYSN